ncbi:MAG: rhomboid family intramembrane serine protease [Saprospiraceae bacterium]|nr:rhomboid family intramembrane serine protease [Saprospiraceae bacterium]
MSITIILVIVTCLVSYFSFNNNQLFYSLAHWPAKEYHHKEFHRLLTSGFVHGGWLHLLINMFVLWQFGGIVEEHFVSFFGPVRGSVFYVIVYLLVIVCASLPSYFNKHENESYMAVGASGGVSGIVFIYILLYPWYMLYLYGIIPIPGIIAGVLYLWYSSYASKNVQDRIDHQAHFYGALFGIAFAVILKPSLVGAFISSLINDFPLS